MKVLVAARKSLANDLAKALAADGIEVEAVTDVTTALSRLGDTTGIVFLDYAMPGLSGTRGILAVRARLGEAPLGVIGPKQGDDISKPAFTDGANGVIPADAGHETLAAALRLLGLGQRFAIYGGQVRPVPLEAVGALTERELQVLRGVCDGMQNKEIAHQFGIREVTVKMHMRAIIKKLSANNRTHAAMIARDLDIV